MRNGVYPHHSSLFFGCDRVNGGNYWQEGLGRGQIVSIGARIVEAKGERVVIEDECIWKRPDAQAPIIDRRKITISSPSKDLYLLDFDIEMEMLMDVTILKTNHSLFSARVDADLTVKQGGVMINSEGKKGEKGTFGVGSALIDCYGKRQTGVEGIAIMQHPSNRWFPSPWFTRDYGQQKILLNRQSDMERRARTRRQIEHGAILESVFPTLAALPGEEVKAFLLALSRLPEAAELLKNTVNNEATE